MQPYSWNTTFLLLNCPAELQPRKGFKERHYSTLELRLCADFTHSRIEAVAGLAGYMAGLRFFRVPTHGVPSPPTVEERSNYLLNLLTNYKLQTK